MLLRSHPVHCRESPGQVVSVSAALLEEHWDGDGGKLADKVTETRAKASKPLARLKSQ